MGEIVDRQLPRPGSNAKDDGFIPKYGLEYKFSDDIMVYGVYSEGFEWAAQTGVDVMPTVVVRGHWFTTLTRLENVEFGLKSEFGGWQDPCSTPSTTTMKVDNHADRGY